MPVSRGVSRYFEIIGIALEKPYRGEENSKIKIFVKRTLFMDEAKLSRRSMKLF